MASNLPAKSAGVECSAAHVHDYALSMLQSAAVEARALPPGAALPISIFLERERANKDVSQQIFNKVCGSAHWHTLPFKFIPFSLRLCQAVFDACAIARAELHDLKIRKSGKVTRVNAVVGARVKRDACAAAFDSLRGRAR